MRLFSYPLFLIKIIFPKTTVYIPVILECNLQKFKKTLRNLNEIATKLLDLSKVYANLSNFHSKQFLK